MRFGGLVQPSTQTTLPGQVVALAVLPGQPEKYLPSMIARCLKRRSCSELISGGFVGSDCGAPDVIWPLSKFAQVDVRRVGAADDDLRAVRVDDRRAAVVAVVGDRDRAGDDRGLRDALGQLLEPQPRDDVARLAAHDRLRLDPQLAVAVGVVGAGGGARSTAGGVQPAWASSAFVGSNAVASAPPLSRTLVFQVTFLSLVDVVEERRRSGCAEFAAPSVAAFGQRRVGRAATTCRLTG